MFKAGIISLKKSSVESHRIFKNNDDNIFFVLEKVHASNLKMVFIKNDEIITPLKDYFYEYTSGDKVETYSKSNNYN
ncbi:3921_t:CDS:1, partial [Cetraspora pellucida]